MHLRTRLDPTTGTPPFFPLGVPPLGCQRQGVGGGHVVVAVVSHPCNDMQPLQDFLRTMS